MKKCPDCAEDIQGEAVRCRYCGSDLAATAANENRAGTARGLQKALGIFLGLLGAAIFELQAYFDMAAGRRSEGLIAAGFGIAFLVVGPIASWIGDVFRRFTMPDRIYAKGAVELFGQRIFWAAGPQAVAAFLAFCGMFAFMGEFGGTTGETAASREAEVRRAIGNRTEAGSTPAERRTVVEAPAALAEGAASLPVVPADTRSQSGTRPSAVEQVSSAERPPAPVEVAPIIESTLPQTAESSRIQASFDCAKAASNIERLICGSPEAAAADKRLAAAYKTARTKTADSLALKAEQEVWLAQERNACADTACLVRVMDARSLKLLD